MEASLDLARICAKFLNNVKARKGCPLSKRVTPALLSATIIRVKLAFGTCMIRRFERERGREKE